MSLSRDRWEQFDKKYLSQLLMRKSAYRLRDEIWDVYYKLNIRDAISFVDQVGTCSGGCVAGWPRQELAGLGWGSPSTYPLARQWARPLPSWVLAVPMPALPSLAGWPRALGCQDGAALHAQPHIHVRVVGH